MKISVAQVGPIQTNCYLLLDEETNRLAVIDPGEEAGRLWKLVQQTGAELELILLTHGHYDHTTAVPELHNLCPQAKVYIHREDANGAGSRLFPLAGQVKDLNFYSEGDRLSLGGLELQVLHTPGHSPGSVTLRVGDVLFTGDTLFAGSCGRIDLNGGDGRAMAASLKRLGELEGEFDVLPGHGPGSTLERERRSNPYLQMALLGREIV